MGWRKKITDNIADILRFAAHLFFAFDAIVLAAFLFWFVAFFIWRLAGWLHFHIFSNPWY